MKTTTKVIAAVLAVLMLSVVFAGAAAAAAGAGETVYVFKYYDAGVYTGTWTLDGSDNSLANSIEFKNTTDSTHGYLSTAKDGSEIKPGTYKQADQKIYVSYPYVKIDLKFNDKVRELNTINTGLIIPTKNESGMYLNFSVDQDSANKLNISGLVFKKPGHATYTHNFVDMKSFENISDWSTLDTINSWDLKKGTWYVYGYLDLDNDTVKECYFCEGMANLENTWGHKYICPVSFKFVVDSDAEYTISVDKTNLTRGGFFTITVTGIKPIDIIISAKDADDEVITLDADLKIDAGQPGIHKIDATLINDAVWNKSSYTVNKNVSINLSRMSSKVMLEFNTEDNTHIGTYTFKIVSDDVTKSVSVKIEKPAKKEITLNVEPNSVIIGEKVKVSGTAGKDDKIYLYIKGVNKDLQLIQKPKDDSQAPGGYFVDAIKVKEDGTFSKELKLANVFDSGKYTIVASTVNFSDKNIIYDKLLMNGNNEKLVWTNSSVYKKADKASVTFTLQKIPFITINPIREHVAIGSTIKVAGTAEGNPGKVQYWIFGTNLFDYGNITVKNDLYSKKIDTDGWYAGSYFLIVQHPRADKQFNVYINDSSKAVVFAPTDFETGLPDKAKEESFSSISTLQTENAAHDLMEFIDAHGQDDLYESEEFYLEDPIFVMNPVADITKGTPEFTVNGYTNHDVGDEVTVTLLAASAEFGEKDKHDLTQSDSSVAGVIVTVKVVAGDEYNTWSAALKSDDLIVGEYIVKAELDHDSKISSTQDAFEVTEASVQPTTEPTGQPTTAPTEQPTPASPGFGALIALAGLGAVALLVLRRN